MPREQSQPHQGAVQTPTPNTSKPGAIRPNPDANTGRTGPAVESPQPPVRKEVDRPGQVDRTPNTTPVPETHVPGSPGHGGGQAPSGR
jgi:hypothetical protein